MDDMDSDHSNLGHSQNPDCEVFKLQLFFGESPVFLLSGFQVDLIIAQDVKPILEMECWTILNKFEFLFEALNDQVSAMVQLAQGQVK